MNFPPARFNYLYVLIDYGSSNASMRGDSQEIWTSDAMMIPSAGLILLGETVNTRKLETRLESINFRLEKRETRNWTKIGNDDGDVVRSI